MSRSVGRYLVELLVTNDIDTVFGIPGVHNLELYRGLAAANIRHVLVRHEQGAGFAADGYARLSGRPAAAFTISGPGLTNILTSVAQAYSDSIPLLVIATTPVRASLGKQWGVLHELQNQWALAAAVFGVARAAAQRRGCARSPAAVLGVVARRPPSPGVFGNSARRVGRVDHAARGAVCRRGAPAASLERANRRGGSPARSRRTAHHHRGRRRAQRGR